MVKFRYVQRKFTISLVKVRYGVNPYILVVEIFQ